MHVVGLFCDLILTHTWRASDMLAAIVMVTIDRISRSLLTVNRSLFISNRSLLVLNRSLLTSRRHPLVLRYASSSRALFKCCRCLLTSDTLFSAVVGLF